MKNMSTIFWIALTIIWILFLFGIKIEFNPFKISFNTIHLGIGILLVVIGIGFSQYHIQRKESKKTTEVIIGNLSDFLQTKYSPEESIKFLEEYKEYLKDN